MHRHDQSAAFFNRTLEDHHNKLLAQGFRTDWTLRTSRVLERFAQFARCYPPFWEPAHFNAYCAMRLTTVQPATLRRDQDVIAQYCRFLRDSDYHFSAEAQQRFGRAPVQIVTAQNRIQHAEDGERRALTFTEVQRLFTYSDARALTLLAAHKKGALAAARDNVLFKTMLAYGPRDGEVRALNVADFSAVPDLPQFGAYGALFIRAGKANAGGPARTRTIYTVPLFDWIVPVLQKYLTDVRPLFAHGDPRALFVTERGTRLAPSTISARFAELRDAALGLDDVSTHSLRHTYSTELAEHGYTELFRQAQLGHTHASSTARYTHATKEYQRRVILNFLARRSRR